MSNLGINNLSAGIGAGANLGGQASRNSFFGALAGRFTGQSSFDNAMFGYNAVVDELPGHTTNRNSLFGSSTYGTSFSSDLTLIGYGARTAPLNPLSNSTAIGSRAQVSASNSLVLGSINGINGATADTNVGIGTTAPTFKLTISDSSNTGLRVVTAGPGGTVASFGGIGAFQVDAPFNPGGRFNIAETGHISFSTLGSGGNETLCRNFSNFQISTCGSSLRYKQNINPFVSGLLLIKQLRPISFNWKDGGMPDLGLGAEDVAAIEPLLVTYNKDGLVEGVKYDRIGVVLVNAVKEQQAQIEAQKKMIELQKIEAAEQKAANQRLQSQMDELKKVVCTLKPDVEICKSGGK